MPRLRDDLGALNALVSRAAQHLDMNPAFVEKDFWVTEVLRVASAPRTVKGSDESVTFVFKGGTSLSRAYGLIDRFSEDVDLLVVFPVGPGMNARHAVLKAVDAEVAAHLAVVSEQAGSTTGVKRNTRYPYPPAFPRSGLKESVLLEMGSRGGAQPTTRHELRSMVAEYAATVLGEGPETWEEFAAFEVEVLAPERTLLEKLDAVHSAAQPGAEPDAIVKAGRHFYDIYKLLTAPIVVNALHVLGPEGVAQLIEDIGHHSEAAGFPSSPRPAGGYAASPAFDPASPVHAEALRGFNAALDLVYGAKPSFGDVMRAVSEHRGLI